MRGHGLEEGVRLGGDLLGNVHLHNVKVVAQLKDNKQFSIHHLMRSLDILIEILDTMYQLLALSTNQLDTISCGSLDD